MIFIWKVTVKENIDGSNLSHASYMNVIASKIDGALEVANEMLAREDTPCTILSISRSEVINELTWRKE